MVKRDRTEILVGKDCYAAAARKGGCAEGRRVKNVLQPSKKGCTPNPGCANYLSSTADNSQRDEPSEDRIHEFHLAMLCCGKQIDK